MVKTEETPDPGAYSDYALVQQSLGRDASLLSLNRRVREGKLAFDSDISRDDGGGLINKDSIGPGRYNYTHMYACGEPKAGPQMDSSFKSKIPMGAYVRKSEVPGAGRYDPEKKDRGNSYSKSGSSAFAGDSPQRPKKGVEVATDGTDLGPASYNVTKSLLHDYNPRLPGFGQSSVRGDPTSW